MSLFLSSESTAPTEQWRFAGAGLVGAAAHSSQSSASTSGAIAGGQATAQAKKEVRGNETSEMPTRQVSQQSHHPATRSRVFAPDKHSSAHSVAAHAAEPHIHSVHGDSQFGAASLHTSTSSPHNVFSYANTTHFPFASTHANPALRPGPAETIVVDVGPRSQTSSSSLSVSSTLSEGFNFNLFANQNALVNFDSFSGALGNNTTEAYIVNEAVSGMVTAADYQYDGYTTSDPASAQFGGYPFEQALLRAGSAFMSPFFQANFAPQFPPEFPAQALAPGPVPKRRSEGVEWLLTHFQPSQTNSIPRDALRVAFQSALPDRLRAGAAGVGRCVRAAFGRGVEVGKIGDRVFYLNLAVKQSSPLNGVVEMIGPDPAVGSLEGGGGGDLSETGAGIFEDGDPTRMEVDGSYGSDRFIPYEQPPPTHVTVEDGTSSTNTFVKCEPNLYMDPTFTPDTPAASEMPPSPSLLSASTSLMSPMPSIESFVYPPSPPCFPFFSPHVPRWLLPPHQASMCSRSLAHLVALKDKWERLDVDGLVTAVHEFWTAVRAGRMDMLDGEAAVVTGAGDVGAEWDANGPTARGVSEGEVLVFSSILNHYLESALVDGFPSSHKADLNRLVRVIGSVREAANHSAGSIADSAGRIVYAAVKDSVIRLQQLLTSTVEMREHMARRGAAFRLTRCVKECEERAVGKTRDWLIAIRIRVADRQPLAAWNLWLRRLVEETLFSARMAPIRSPDGWLVTEGEGYSERINLGRGREQVLWDALKDLLVPMREAFEMVEAAGCAVELRPVKHYLTWQLDAISSVVFRDLRAASFPFRSPSSALQVNPLLLRFLVQRGYFDPAAVAAVQTRALGGRSEPLEVEDAWECVAGLVGLMEGHDRYYGSIETGLNDDGVELTGMKRSLSLAFGKAKIRDDYNVRSIPKDSATAQILRTARKPQLLVIPATPPPGLLQLQLSRQAFSFQQQVAGIQGIGLGPGL